MLKSGGEDFFFLLQTVPSGMLIKTGRKQKLGKKKTRVLTRFLRVSALMPLFHSFSVTFPLDFLLTAEEVFGTRKPRRRSLTPAFPSFVVLLQGELEKRGEGLNFAVTFILSEGLWNQGSIARHRCLDTGCSCSFYRNDGIGGVEEHDAFLSDSSFIINTTPTGELVGHDLWCRCGLLPPVSLLRAECRCDLSIISGAVVWCVRSLAGDTGSRSVLKTDVSREWSANKTPGS